MKNKRRKTTLVYLLTANAIVLLTAVYAGAIEVQFPDFYYFSIQEDEYVEWASFWAFMLAAAASLFAARRYRVTEARLPWYFVCLAAFCFLIAMEEISWGQRVLGYRPPVYFLEHNYQQELNIHNVIDTDYRKLVLRLSILGYGVFLPLLALWGTTRRLLDQIGVIAAPAGLMPAFVATFLVYDVYPWSHSGEWVELMLGTGILLSVLPDLRGDRASAKALPGGLPGGVVIASAATLALGLISSTASRAQRDAHPATLEAAQAEVEAIRRDFESGRVRSRCSIHKRLYTFVVQYDQPNLLRGEFASLKSQGLPEERADFLLDPWNSPYWIRDRCDRETRRRVVFVYSFGPNRRRDSTVLEIKGDDVGAYITPP